MKKLILFSAAATLALSSAGQTPDYPFSKWDKATLDKANTAKDASYLTDEEKKVIWYMNLVRLNPELFEKTYYKKFMDSTKAKPTSFTRSLENDLTVKYKPLGVYTPKEDLSEEAKDHAKDMGTSGKIGHFTSDGKSYEFRMKKLRNTYTETAENCDYAHKDALSIVMNLLIDENVGSVEHRKTILDKNLKYAGASIQPHKKEKWNCVIDFAK